MNVSEFSGTLYKRRNGFGKLVSNPWKKRFVVYKNNMLTYFKQNDIIIPRGIMVLTDYDIFTNKIEKSPTQYVFQIKVTNVNTWTFCAENETDYNAWIQLLTNTKQSNVDLNLNSESDTDFDTDSDKPQELPLVSVSSEESLEEKNGDCLVENISDDAKTTLFLSYCYFKLVILLFFNIFINTVSSVNYRTVIICCFVISILIGISSYADVHMLNDLFVLVREIISHYNPINKSSVLSCDDLSTIPLLETVTLFSTKESLKNNADRLVPGRTYKQSELQECEQNTWSVTDHTNFFLRGVNYLTDKIKNMSDEPIYTPFAVDVFKTNDVVNNIAQKFQLPDVSDMNTNNKIPQYFVVQIQLPLNVPTFFAQKKDTQSLAIVLFFKLNDTIDKNSTQIALFEKWCNNAIADNEWKGRFKLTNKCSNLKDVGFSSFIESYNAKPILIRRTSSVFKGHNYIEVDIHVHEFDSMAQRSINMLMLKSSKLFMQMGFTIEGRKLEELPEKLIGCVAINQPQLSFVNTNL